MGTCHLTPSSDLDRAVECARSCLLGMQQPDGHWVGELEGDTILESEYILLLQFMDSYKVVGDGGAGRSAEPGSSRAWVDPVRLNGLANHLRAKQLPAGGWSLYPGG